MGLSINTNNKDMWEVVSSITGSVVATFTNESELKNWLALEKIYDGKLNAINLLMSYPNGWNVNEERQRKESEFLDWKMSIQKSETYEEYYQKIDEKLNELLPKKE